MPFGDRSQAAEQERQRLFFVVRRKCDVDQSGGIVRRTADAPLHRVRLTIL
jgi:hypothetical protein